MRIYITGIGGLVGSTLAVLARQRGWSVIGCDADYRGHWFGPQGSVFWRLAELENQDIEILRCDFRETPLSVLPVDVIAHCASQPSHDFSRSNPLGDMAVNAVGTLQLLEMVRHANPAAVFIFISTNKVYGDSINTRSYMSEGKRLVPIGMDLEYGVSENFPVDRSRHTPFGVSKLAADLMVQEYRSCYNLRTVCFRCGCITGAGGSPVEQQGFLGYLVHCAVHKLPYTIYGYGGRQVRDNLAAQDLAKAILLYAQRPRGAVYNMGGGPANSLSVREAIDELAALGYPLTTSLGPPRYGDHRWWITDTRAFQAHYDWTPQISVKQVFGEMVRSECESRRAAQRDSVVAAGAE